MSADTNYNVPQVQAVKIESTDEYPANTVVRLIAVTEKGPYLCSGTLIAPDLVLTAAHCLVRDGVWFKRLRVTVPSTDETIQAINAVVPTVFLRRSWALYDFALVKLENSAKQGAPILDTYHLTPDSKQTVVGEKIRLIGFPKGDPDSLYEVSCDVSQGTFHWLLFYGCDVEQGMSGGLLYLEENEETIQISVASKGFKALRIGPTLLAWSPYFSPDVRMSLKTMRQLWTTGSSS